jgi:hypothetical protein
VKSVTPVKKIALPGRSTKKPGLGSEANRHDRAESGLTAPQSPLSWPREPPIEAVMGSRKHEARNAEYQAASSSGLTSPQNVAFIGQQPPLPGSRRD